MLYRLDLLTLIFNTLKMVRCFYYQLIFVLKFRYLYGFFGFMRKLYFIAQGMKISKGTVLPKLYVTWPHQVSIGEFCILEPDIIFKFDGIWKSEPSIFIHDRVFIGYGCEFNIRLTIQVGDDSLIASGCKFIDHDHGIVLGHLVRLQHGPEKEIKIGKDVWLGINVIVLKGVTIADGAIVAAGAVVTKSIPKNEIWAGIPAKKIGERNLINLYK